LPQLKITPSGSSGELLSSTAAIPSASANDRQSDGTRRIDLDIERDGAVAITTRRLADQHRDVLRMWRFFVTAALVAPDEQDPSTQLT
jgi:hypothetical protein